MYEDVEVIENLTPHEINVYVGKVVLDFPPSGNVARLHRKSKKIGEAQGIPVFISYERRIIGVPGPKKGTVYLVSSVIAKEVRRPDVLAPDTTDDGVIRDGAGNIKGVTRFQSFCDDHEMR